jgi:hypothetical protein
VLIGIFTVLFLYYGSHHATAVAPDFDQAEKRVKRDVKDESRRQQALEIIGRMKAETTSYVKQRKDSTESLDKVLSRRDVTGLALRAAVEPLMATDAATRDRLLELRFQLKQVLTADEWALVYPAPKSP